MITEDRVLFEDNHLIAINKLPGELVQVDKTTEESLEISVKEFIREKYKKPGEAFLGVCHRLDRPTSGIVLFAKTSKALVRVNELFKTKDIKKTYWAVVKNKPPKESDKLIHYLLKDEKKNTCKAFDKEVKYSQYAELDYKLIASSESYHLLEIQLHTGRHHQIRSQLSKIGCSIKGDIKYGFARTNPNGAIHLHARKLQFTHPVKNEQVTILATPPLSDVVWKAFYNQVNQNA